MTMRLWFPFTTALILTTAVNAGEELPRCGGHDMGGPSQPGKAHGHDHGREDHGDEPRASRPVVQAATSLTSPSTSPSSFARDSSEPAWFPSRAR